MADNTKTPLVLLIILTVISTSLAVTFFVMKEQEKQQKITAEQNFREAVKAKEEVLKDLEEVTRLKTDAELELEQLKEEARQLSLDLEKEKREAEDALANLSDKEKKLQDLSNTLEEEKAKVEELAQTVESYKNQNETLNMQLSQIRVAKQALEDKIMGSSKGGSVQLEKIVVKGGAQNIAGRVLVVNNEFNFVVLDLGQGSGIEAGTVLTITRTGEVIGKVEVENVYEDMSSAIILPDYLQAPIEEDDCVELL